MLQTQPKSEMSPAQFGAWLARRVGRVDTRGEIDPFSDQAVRNWMRDGMPVERNGRKIYITDPDSAYAWWKANKGFAVGRGGEREGAGRKGSGKAAPGQRRKGPGVESEDGGRKPPPQEEGDGRRDAAPTGGSGSLGAESEAGGINALKADKLSIETERHRFNLDVLRGRYIDRGEAAEGTSRVLTLVVRELGRLPARVAEDAADRMNLASEEQARLLAIVTERIEAMRREIAADPLGDEEEEDGRRDAAPTEETEAA